MKNRKMADAEVEVVDQKRGFLKMRHVHVYRVVSLLEVDVMTTSDFRARQAGLDEAVKPKTAFKRPDCRFIALVPGNQKAR